MTAARASDDAPRVLIVPGWTSSGPEHWQTLWDRADPRRFRRVEQPTGAAGHVNTAAGFGPWPRGERLLEDLSRGDRSNPLPPNPGTELFSAPA